MTYQPKYDFLPDRDRIRIIDREAEFALGYVEFPSGRCRLKTYEGHTVGFVDQIQDAVAILDDYHAKHPQQWEQDSPTQYGKQTRFGFLSVIQEPLGYWSVYRNDYIILLYDGRPAAFRTREEAKAAADAHMGDEVAKRSEDGFEWYSLAN